MAKATERAYVNEHDTIVFLNDDDERLQDFLDAGYREVGPDDRIVRQAAEDSTFVWEGSEVAYADVADGVGPVTEVGGDHADVVEYVRKVRALRSRNDKARKADQPPAKILRKGRG